MIGTFHKGSTGFLLSCPKIKGVVFETVCQHVKGGVVGSGTEGGVSAEELVGD